MTTKCIDIFIKSGLVSFGEVDDDLEGVGGVWKKNAQDNAVRKLGNTSTQINI